MLLKQDVTRRTEHEAVRNKVGYYDFTHQLLEVEGKDAAAFLDWIYVNSIAKTSIGKAKYTTMLNEKGKIIDDVIVFRMDENKFWISTLYIKELIAWFDAHKGEYEIEYRDITPQTTMYALQGPNSRELINRILETKVDDLGFYTITDNKIGSIEVKVARSGFTGELGYEIYCAPANAKEIEEVLIKNGEDLGLMKITTDVIITSLPGEKGYVLMSDIGNHNPFEVDFGWTVDMTKDFIGKQATQKIIDRGPLHQLLGFCVDVPGEMFVGDEAMANGDIVGVVTKYTYGYTIEKYIGYIYTDEILSLGSKIQIGDKGISATITERIWYDKENTRVRG